MPTRQLAFDFAPAPAPSLHNFIPGRNRELLHALRQLLAPEGRERSLYVWGGPGSGRTHLLRAAIAAVLESGRPAGYIACAGGRLAPPEGERLHCIAADDVHRLDAEGQIALFNLCNSLRERGGVLLAGGDVPPGQLALRQDLGTRLGWGLVYEVHALSDEEKTDALKQHAAARGFALADEVCAFLFARAPRDMPSLLALLDALDRHSLEVKRPVTVALARELLQAAHCDGGGQ